MENLEAANAGVNIVEQLLRRSPPIEFVDVMLNILKSMSNDILLMSKDSYNSENPFTAYASNRISPVDKAE